MYELASKICRSDRPRKPPQQILAAIMVRLDASVRLDTRTSAALTLPGGVDRFKVAGTDPKEVREVTRDMSPSSSGLGHRPFTAVTRVRIPSGTPIKSITYKFFRSKTWV